MLVRLMKHVGPDHLVIGLYTILYLSAELPLGIPFSLSPPLFSPIPCPLFDIATYLKELGVGESDEACRT